MVLPNDHDDTEGCRYVPFSSSGGARPLPYPFGRRSGGGSERERGLLNFQRSFKQQQQQTPPPPPPFPPRQNDTLPMNSHKA